MEAEETAQQLSAFTTLAEDSGLVSSTHIVSHTHLYVQFQRIQLFFWLLKAPDTYIVNIHINSGNILTYIR